MADTPEISLRLRVSGLGWLCAYDEGEWIALFKLTDDQWKMVIDWKRLAGRGQCHFMGFRKAENRCEKLEGHDGPHVWGGGRGTASKDWTGPPEGKDGGR